MNKITRFALLATLAFFIGYGGTEAEARSVVSSPGVDRGTILIQTSKRRLYLGLGNGKAVSYRIGVGRAGRQWTGQRRIYAKALKPAWRPTPDIRRDKPNIASIIPGGSPKNPMGAAALLISGSGQYAIHGTNNPGSIGGYVSYGCIRMHNKDVMDLYSRVGIGTRVIVTK
ncbi:MAG: L,D-transpeptidase [Rhizobiaceae bacterium]